MILKIKKDDFNWLYIETNCFEIYSTYDEIPPNNKDVGPIAFSYADTKTHNFISIERMGTPTEPRLDKDGRPLKTFITTDNTTVMCVGEFTGFILNNEGQTVERL